MYDMGLGLELSRKVARRLGQGTSETPSLANIQRSPFSQSGQAAGQTARLPITKRRDETGAG